MRFGRGNCGPIPSLTCGRGPPLFARLKTGAATVAAAPSPVSLFHTRCQRRNSGSGFYWRYCCNRRCFQRRFDRFRFFNRFWNRLIPGRKLFTFTGSLLFHFFKIVKRRTRGFCLFYNGFRLHNRLLFNGLRLLVQRLLSSWLLISLLRLVCRLWSKSGLLLFGLPGVTCHRLFWRRA